MLSQLIYASKAAAKMDYPQLKEINEIACRFNTARSVTGLLVFGSSSFLQILEGDRPTVNQTYHRIARDPRHENPILIDVSEIPERSFQNWAMKLIVLDGANGARATSALLRFGISEHFSPHDFSGESAPLFLREISRLLATP
jgi:hypothetical protein